MSRFIIERLSKTDAYVPGEQPRDMQYIKLNTNESPFPPSPFVIDALNKSEVEKLNLYSDPTVKPLNAAIANFYGVSEDMVFVGNGSDEVLAFAFQAFCNEKNALTFPDITYGCYKVFADLYGIPYTQIALDENLAIDVNDYSDINNNIVIANPNAQTGTYIDICDIEKLVSENKDRLVIVDEAYIDFGGKSAVCLVDSYDNLLVVQTFSKSRSLAGARVGFAIGNRELIADITKIKYSFNPYNINRLSMLAAVCAIDDRDYFDNCRTEIIKNREWTKTELSKLGFVYTDSRSNFILAKNEKISGEELYIKLKSKGILVRHFKDERISNHIRITVGSFEQMQSLICAIKEILDCEGQI